MKITDENLKENMALLDVMAGLATSVIKSYSQLVKLTEYCGLGIHIKMLPNNGIDCIIDKKLNKE